MCNEKAPPPPPEPEDKKKDGDKEKEKEKAPEEDPIQKKCTLCCYVVVLCCVVVLWVVRPRLIFVCWVVSRSLLCDPHTHMADKFPYITTSREPRRPDVGSMRFLLYAGAQMTEIQDVKTSIEEAFTAQKYKKSTGGGGSGGKKFEIVCQDSNRLLTLNDLLEYDAVYTWSGSAGYCGGFNELLTKYYEAGGGVVVSAIACNSHQNNYSLTDPFLKYCPWTAGAQATGASSLTLPKASESKSNPLLKMVKSFNGGNGSYRSRVNVANGGKLVASWADGTPLLIDQGKKQSGKKGGHTVLLNIYPPSSRNGASAQYWNPSGGSNHGHHLMLNALVHCATNATHKRRKPSSGKTGGGGGGGGGFGFGFGGGGGGYQDY